MPVDAVVVEEELDFGIYVFGRELVGPYIRLVGNWCDGEVANLTLVGEF
jgi:hypothetical protein